MSLEPVKVFRELSNSISATKAHFDEFSAGVSKLLKLKDEILYQAVSRKTLSQQQLANLTVTCSSLFLSKAAIQEQFRAVNAAAASSVQQAEQLPTRALMRWTVIASRLLKQAHVSEHLQIRYRTARMLEIWDLAAQAIPASPQPSPRMSISKQSKRTTKQATAPPAAASTASARPAGKTASGDLDAKPAARSGTAQAQRNSSDAQPAASSAGVSGTAKPAGGMPQSGLTFPTLPAFTAADRGSDASASSSMAVSQRASQDMPSSTSSPTLSKPPSVRQRDVPLLQINPAQLSRSTSQVTSSAGEESSSSAQAPSSAAAVAVASAAALTKVGDAATPVAIPTFSSPVASTSGADYSAPLTELGSQGSGVTNLLAAVNAVVGGLNLRHTASLTSGVALSPIAERSEVESAANNAASVSGRQPNQMEASLANASAGNGVVAGPDLFTGMSGFRRTRSNLRTGASMTSAAAGDLSRMTSIGGGAGEQLMHQTSRGMQQARVGQQTGPGQLVAGAGLNLDSAAVEEVDWRS